MKPGLFVGLGLGALLALSSLFWFTDLDLTVASLTYSASFPHWPFSKDWLWRTLKHYGPWPGVMLGVGAIAGWAASWFNVRRRAWRSPCLFVACSVLLGPGLVVNLIAKQVMGRPRPYEIVQFGGTFPFVRPFGIGFPGRCTSFVSGHASMAFVFMSLFFVLRGWMRWTALAGGMLYGLLVGTARILQGDHFLSDILLCGAILFTIAAAMRCFWPGGRAEHEE